MQHTPPYDFLIVGAGLYGATCAYMAQQHNKRCLVIDRRPHVGGNLFCEQVDGINIHKYGAHIFHTSSQKVWSFVNKLAQFNRYTNCPVACYKGKMFNLPFNMNTFYQMWGVTTPQAAMKKIEEQRSEYRNLLASQGINEPRNLEEQALLLVGQDIYRTLIKGYTEKQWGRPCTALPAFIIRRLPLRFVFDNNYFNDSYQGIPIGGYNTLIENMLQCVEVHSNADFFENRHSFESMARHIIYTGPIDCFFDYKEGVLEYRTLRFEQEMLPTANYQGNAVVNFTDVDIPYTRIIEHKHFEMFGNDVYKLPHTIITKEYSAEWHEGVEPYYPVNNDINNARYAHYKALASTLPNVTFGGRLGEYRYMDMAPTIDSAMKAMEKLLSSDKQI